MMEKKLLYICNRVFWPPMGGHETEIYHYCRGLHDVYGYIIDVYIFEENNKIDYKNKPIFINKVYTSENISYFEKIKNLVRRSQFGRNAWPIQCALYYSKENEDKIRSITKEKYDVIFVDMIRLAPYYYSLSDSAAKKILDIDDTLSKRYKRQLTSLDEKTKIAGQYNDRLPGFIQKLISSSFVKKLILKYEIPRMERAEELYASLYDNVVFVSSIETDEFNAKYPGNKAVTMAMGVDYRYFSECKNINQEEGTASFVGNMKTAANIDSVRLIIHDIIPHCKHLKKVYFIGIVTDELRKEFENNSHVCFTGKVDDLRDQVKKTQLFLSPLAYGTGIKTKILEAMAMGMPVVTNSVGAEGIDAKSDVHWLVSDEKRKIAEYVDCLIMDENKRKEIGKNAQELIEEQFQWEYIFNGFSNLGI